MNVHSLPFLEHSTDITAVYPKGLSPLSCPLTRSVGQCDCKWAVWQATAKRTSVLTSSRSPPLCLPIKHSDHAGSCAVLTSPAAEGALCESDALHMAHRFDAELSADAFRGILQTNCSSVLILALPCSCSCGSERVFDEQFSFINYRRMLCWSPDASCELWL